MFRLGRRAAPIFSVFRRTLINSWVWQEPKGLSTGVSIHNSLTHSDENLRLSKNGSSLSWYSCGPTVYDQSHIGHGRCYMQQDIILRILEKFNIDLHHAIGVTDIDDKIIQKTIDTKASSITEVARHYEESFWADMAALGIKQPAVTTRVSEHMDEIQKLVIEMYNKGFAYKGKDGSIYFDTLHYRNTVAMHPKPERSKLSLEELLPDPNTNENKKHDADFVLWKASNEKSEMLRAIDAEWALQLGSEEIRGRPGWHIECSAMCNKTFGDVLDVHAGGIDLLFPHHCNEVAQSQAFYYALHGEYKQWPNYFVHIGHLHIQGLKMSKSLKNFITIQEFLKENTGDDLRWLCFMNYYRSTLEISDARIANAKVIQGKLFNFMNELLFKRREITSDRMWQSEDHKLFRHFIQMKQTSIGHLQRDFDTPKVMDSIMDFLGTANIYLNSNVSPPLNLLKTILDYFVTFFSEMGFVKTIPSAKSIVADTGVNNQLDELVSTIVTVRNDMRSVLLDKTKEPAKKVTELFKLSDSIRSDLLDNFNVEVKDRSNEKSTWQFVQKSSKDTKSHPE